MDWYYLVLIGIVTGLVITTLIQRAEVRITGWLRMALGAAVVVGLAVFIFFDGLSWVKTLWHF